MTSQSTTPAFVRPKKKIDWSAYGYLSPALISIAILSVAPILYTIYIAFTNFNQAHFQHYDFVGFKNFTEIFNKDGPLGTLFIPTLLWTIGFAFFTTVLNFIVGAFLAVVLNNKNMREAAFYRAILIIPWAVPGLISILAWQGLLNQSYGQVNALLGLFHIKPVPWLLNPFWTKFSIFMVNLWLGFPYMMTVVLGAAQAVPGDLYEAASIDGATWWQKFRSVTMPGIFRITLPPLISTFAFNFNNFMIIYLLNGGGPERPDNPFIGSSDILASSIYKMTLNFNRYDLASAMSIVMFVIVGILSYFQMRVTGAFSDEEGKA